MNKIAPISPKPPTGARGKTIFRASMPSIPKKEVKKEEVKKPQTVDSLRKELKKLDEEVKTTEQKIRDLEGEIRTLRKSKGLSYSEMSSKMDKLENTLAEENQKLEDLNTKIRKTEKLIEAKLENIEKTKKALLEIKNQEEVKKEVKKEEVKKEVKKEEVKKEEVKPNGKDPWDDPKYIGKPLRCNVCMYATDRKLNFETHLNSKKHMKNMEIDRQLEEIEKYKDKPQSAPAELKDKKGNLKSETDIVESLYKKHKDELSGKTFNSTTELKRYRLTKEYLDLKANEKFNTVEGMTKLIKVEQEVVNKYKQALEKLETEQKKSTKKDNKDEKIMEEIKKLDETISDYKDKLKKAKKININKSKLSVGEISSLIDKLETLIEIEEVKRDKLKNSLSKNQKMDTSENKSNYDKLFENIDVVRNNYEKSKNRLDKYKKRLTDLKNNPNNILSKDEISKLTSKKL